MTAMDAQPPAAVYAGAEAAFADGEFERAIDLLETVLAEDAEDIAALDLLGQVAQRIDALDSAIDAYQRVLAIDPVYRDTAERLASAQARAGDGPAAYETLNSAVASHGQRPEFWLVMGNVMLSMALFDEEAAAAYGKALEINPRSAAARMNLSEAELRRGRVDHALTLARAAAEGAPTMPGVFDNLAQILLATGHYGEAWAAFEKRFDHFGASPQFDLKARDFPQPRWRGEPLPAAAFWSGASKASAMKFITPACFRHWRGWARRSRWNAMRGWRRCCGAPFRPSPWCLVKIRPPPFWPTGIGIFRRRPAV